MREDGDILGRYDARFEGTDVDNAGETPGYDPSDTGIAGAFVAAFHDYLANDSSATRRIPITCHRRRKCRGTMTPPHAGRARLRRRRRTGRIALPGR